MVAVAGLGETKAPDHPYNDPDLSAIEFLQAVMHATHLPMATRIDAARALLPFTESVPRPCTPPAYTLVIPPISYEPWAGSCSPWPRSTANDSQNPSASNTAPIQGPDTPTPQNLTTDPEPRSLPDYSSPPTPEDLQAIKAAINKLRPDLAHLPIPEFHLCPCGHWITGSYPCCETRYKTRMN